MRFQSLEQWLSWQEGLHPTEIDLGLERVQRVLQRLAHADYPFAIITVGGTNGKGSCVAMLEAIYLAAGYRVGSYTSPHLLRYNERIHINGEEIDDASLCQAFQAVDAARAEDSLTYFEFGTLAALEIFDNAGLDVVVLEVGLGGRLDAVNVLDPEVALIATIDLDHGAWLGNDRESVGREKAGIMRCGRPVVCGDPNPPASITATAQQLGAELKLLGRDFGFQVQQGQWRWWLDDHQRDALPLPSLRGEFQLRNAAAVLAVVDLLQQRLPVSQTNIRSGLTSAAVPGRFQVISGDVPLIVDVAHNPQAAAALAANLASWLMPGRIFAITAVMADKDIAGIFRPLLSVIDHWCLTSIAIPRAAGSARLVAELKALGVSAEVETAPSVAEALAMLRRRTVSNDRIVVFGSFYTVAEALQAAYNARSNPSSSGTR